jgi:hypothetical protein
MDVEKKNFSIILTYWLQINRDRYIKFQVEENKKPLYCSVKIIKAFCKDILTYIMDDRFKMFREILLTFYKRKFYDKQYS